MQQRYEQISTPAPRSPRIASARTTLAALFGLLWAAGGAAQDSIPTREARIDTLTVRVLQSPQPLLRAPYAVSVVDAERLPPGPRMALDEALRDVPGVQVDNRYNYALGERISIRGFGARSQFGVRGVRVVVDGIPATLPDGQSALGHIESSLLRRVEVIRGPASALYGNASGGVIRMTTLSPPPGELAAEYEAVAGEAGLLRHHLAAGGTTGRWEYLGGASGLRFEGFREHSRSAHLRGQANVAYRGSRDDLALHLHGVRYDALNPGSLSEALLRESRTRVFPRNRLQRTGEEGRQLQGGASWRRRTRAGTAEISGHLIARAIDNPIPNAIIDLRRRAGGARAVFHADPIGDGVLWSGGAEWGGQRDDRLNFENVGGERGARVLDQRERVGAGALFAQASAPFGRLELQAALRYDRTRFAAEDRMPVSPADPDDSGERTMSALSPTLAASWRALPGVTVYGNYSTAFETPTTTELTNRPDGAGGFNPELRPQRTRSLEGGIRARVAPSAYLEAAVYRARVRDVLVPYEVEGAAGRQFFRNAGTATHRGLELGFRAELENGVSAGLAYSGVDARFGPGGGSAAPPAGNRVPGVTPHRLETRLGWSTPRGPFAEVRGRFSSETPADDENLAASPAYALMDFTAGWRALRIAGGRITPFAGIANLLDTEYNSSLVVNAFGGRYYEPGPGRAFHAGVRVATGVWR